MWLDVDVNGGGNRVVARLDWMYEQSAASVKPNDDELMNMPISAQKARRSFASGSFHWVMMVMEQGQRH